MKNKEQNTWLEQYVANYNGKSAEAKEIASYLKETYKGDKYFWQDSLEVEKVVERVFY